jgi:hypothetical protein
MELTTSIRMSNNDVAFGIIQDKLNIPGENRMVVKRMLINKDQLKTAFKDDNIDINNIINIKDNIFIISKVLVDKDNSEGLMEVYKECRIVNPESLKSVDKKFYIGEEVLVQWG